MPVSLRAQATAVDQARRVLLGHLKPRRAEAEEIARDLDEASHTLWRLNAAGEAPRVAMEPLSDGDAA